MVRVLGTGGMGVVYEAVDRRHGRRVALKTLRRVGPELRRRFKNEFRAIQGIHHENLVRLGDLFEEDGQLYFTMELVDGVPFLAYVRPDGGVAGRRAADDHQTFHRVRRFASEDIEPIAEAPPPSGFDEARLRAALAQLAAGITALHAAGRVHRDIKSSNVLVTPEGRVVILDFSLITDLTHAEEDGVVGTAHFMAPEQAAGRPVGPEADWYGVGVMLYVALTGEFPFAAAPETAMSLKQQYEPSRPGHIVKGLPDDLEDLCVRLLRRDPGARLSGIEAFWMLAATDQPEVPLALPAGDRFVGRARELDALAQRFAEARAGEGAIAIVEGESGIGKSTLVRRFLETIDASALVLRGRCHERDTVPYKAVDDIFAALRRYLSSLPEEEIEALLPPGAAALVKVFPDLRVRGAAKRGPIDPVVLRAEAFAALRELLRRIAETRPLCLAIDDLQWADADSLQLLAEVMRPPGAPRLLLVATRTARDEGADRAPIALPEPIASADRIVVGRLPADHAAVLVRAILHESELGDRLDAAAIAAESGGHPFLLDALVRHRLLHATGEGLVRLDDALWTRVTRLPPPSRRLVELAAVAGVPLDLGIAAHAADTTPEEVRRALVPAQAANLVRLGGADPDEIVEPYHERVREAVIERLDPATTRAWHARLARAIEATGRADLTTLGVHLRGAGEPARAARCTEEAADQAAAALAFDRAARLYRLTIDLRREADLGGGSRALHVKLADALANAGRGAEAAPIYEGAAAHAPADVAQRLTHRAARCYLCAGYIDEGLAALRRALSGVGLRFPAARAKAMAEIVATRAALLARGLGFKPRAESDVDRRDLARIDTCWAASNGLSMVDPILAAAFQTRHLRLALEAGEPGRVALALALEASFVAISGAAALPRAEVLLARADAEARRAGDPYQLAWIAGARGAAMFLSGLFRPALGWLARADALMRDRCAGVGDERTRIEMFALWCHWYLGDLRVFVARVGSALREAEERGNRFAAANLRTGLMISRWLVLDDPERARAEVAEALSGRSRTGGPLQGFHDAIAASQHDLYTGPTPATYHRLMADWPAFEAYSARIELIRITTLYRRAAVAVACARRGLDRRAMLDRALADARSLDKERAAIARPHAALIRAANASIQGADGEALRFADMAARGFESAQMAVYAAAARRRWGELLGGEEGHRVVAAANAWMRGQGVVNPDRMTMMLAPGFEE
ncbi:MAG: AAA family ATPase [Minicystis sp.]